MVLNRDILLVSEASVHNIPRMFQSYQSPYSVQACHNIYASGKCQLKLQAFGTDAQLRHRSEAERKNATFHRIHLRQERALLCILIVSDWAILSSSCGFSKTTAWAWTERASLRPEPVRSRDLAPYIGTTAYLCRPHCSPLHSRWLSRRHRLPLLCTRRRARP